MSRAVIRFKFGGWGWLDSKGEVVEDKARAISFTSIIRATQWATAQGIPDIMQTSMITWELE